MAGVTTVVREAGDFGSFTGFLVVLAVFGIVVALLMRRG